MQIEEILNDLKNQGLSDEEIISSLEKMLEEQKITEEDFAKAKELLLNVKEEMNKEEAQKLFGLDFIK
jgi:hypothetical protein